MAKKSNSVIIPIKVDAMLVGPNEHPFAESKVDFRKLPYNDGFEDDEKAKDYTGILGWVNKYNTKNPTNPIQDPALKPVKQGDVAKFSKFLIQPIEKINFNFK